MNNTVIIYKSKYGSTKTYAYWIKENLNADIFNADKITLKDLLKYKNIIYGGGLYASGISGFSLISKNFQKIKEKNIILFTVGLANPENKEQFIPILNKNLSKEMKNKIKVFHFRGSINYKNLNFIHKTMMFMLKKSIEKTPIEKRDSEINLMLETYGKEVDFTDRNYITPLLNFYKSL